MSAPALADILKPNRSFWTTSVRALFQPQPMPTGWLRAAIVLLGLNAIVIVGCVVGSRYLAGNSDHLFGEGRPGTLASVAVLAGAGVVCLKIRNRVRGLPIASFWFAFGCLLCVAAADDLTRGHEQFDHIIHKLLLRNRDDKITDHLDDLLVAFYALPAFYLAFVHRRRLIEARLTIQLLALAFAVFAVHLIIDFVTNHMTALEESLKLTAGCGIFLAFYATLKQQALPASWMTPHPAAGLLADSPPAQGVQTLATSQRWVRRTAVAVYVAMACAIVGAMFAASAATRDATAATMYRGFATIAVIGAAALFMIGHELLGYANGLPYAVTTAPAAVAHRRIWRTATCATTAALVLAIVMSTWASRQFPYAPKIKRKSVPTRVTHG